MVGPEDLFFTSGIVSGTGGVLDEATPALVATVALLTLSGVSVSYGIGAAAMAAVSSLCIHALYGSSTTAIDPLPQIDPVRSVGNFAAHPLKDVNTGSIVEVEPVEAEWLLDTIKELLDFTFVKPRKLEERRKSLSEKLESAGKPPLKE